jgi:hypothetical protein
MIDSSQTLLTCPLAEGDRVDHAKFGLGNVTAIDGGPSQNTHDPAPKWKVEVVFDGDVGPKRVIHTFLTMVGSPETRPFIFWDKQWQALRQAWLDARRRHEVALMTFRPPPHRSEVERLRGNESEALEALEAFIASDAEGRHA